MSGLMAKGPPPTPGFFIFLKIALGVLSFAVFIAACFNVAQLNGISGDAFVGFGIGAGPGGLGIWTCLFTWAFLGVEIFLGMSMHNLYIRIVFIIWLALDFIFWLATWANAARFATIFAPFLSACADSGFSGCSGYGGSLDAIAAIGAFCWCVIRIFPFLTLLCFSDSPLNTH
jgi:hypothetical protein